MNFDTPERLPGRVLMTADTVGGVWNYAAELIHALESHGVEVLHAERGREGIDILKRTPGVDVALVDIMMPDMDGYETMREIRQSRGFADLPLIAVTAKAMKGDRRKCLDAGASDYIAKPVDIDLLLALLRVWVSRSRATAQTGRSVVEASRQGRKAGS
jgi:CheY-like chemotaxis protein